MLDVPHIGFIVTAYAVTAAVIGALVVWVVADGRVQKAALDDLDRHGARRRPERRA